MAKSRFTSNADETGSTQASLAFVALCLDIVMLSGSAGLAVAFRALGPFWPDVPSTIGILSVCATLSTLGWLFLVWFQGGYREHNMGAGMYEYSIIARTGLFTAAALGIACYLAKFNLSRAFFVAFFCLGLLGLLLGRLSLRRTVQQARSRGHLRKNTIIVGDGAHGDEMAELFKRQRWLGYEVVGVALPGATSGGFTPRRLPVLGPAEKVASLAEEHLADAVVIASGAFTTSRQVRELAWDLEESNTKVVIAPSALEMSRERIRFRAVGGLPLMFLEDPRATLATRWGKRVFDMAGSSALALLFSPVIAFAALRIWLDDRGPVFFRQTRTGRDGAEFTCWKLRTMAVDAERQLAQLHEQCGHTDGLFKMREDPRITTPGVWLRRYSIDELPQLWNVFRGEMSLVGPRPPLPHEVARYDDAMRRRLRVRPGMTGLWQVSGRSELSWEDSIRLDLYYVDNWSMLQDMTILLRTGGAVVHAQGAY